MMTHPRVLVVDDNVELNDTLCEFFREEGFDVVPAASGRQAVARAAHRPPDVIVLDVVLPDINGIAVLDRLGQAGVAAPVILESCLPIPADPRAGAFLPKPFDLDRLLNLVQQAVAERTSGEQPIAP